MATIKENERLATLEEKVNTVVEDMKEVKGDLKTLVSGLDEKFIGLEKKFAPRWVEKFAIAIISIILTAFFAVLVTAVFDRPEVATIPTTKTVTVTVNTNGTTTTRTTENGHTTTSTRPSSTDEKPGTTTVITEGKGTPAQKDDNGELGTESKEDPKQSTVPILGPLVDNLKDRLGRN